MFKILLLGLSWFAASSYGKTPKEWAFHFREGNLLEKTWQMIVTAVLCLLFAYNIMDIYRDFIQPNLASQLEATTETPTHTSVITAATPSAPTTWQHNIEIAQKSLASHETELKQVLDGFQANTFKYYVSKDYDNWHTNSQQSCQQAASSTSDTEEQQLLRLQCLNGKYIHYISHLRQHRPRIEQLAKEYQHLLQQYQHTLLSNQPSHQTIHQQLKSKRTQCENQPNSLLRVLECKIAATQQARAALLTLQHAEHTTTAPKPSAPASSKGDLDNLF